ncbi:MAG TPA: hypothetical protein VMN39_06350 [Longimicrobiaceae bacterium]|nr:hypothetical protein [Longimicrobiaceae bacterium]
MPLLLLLIALLAAAAPLSAQIVRVDGAERDSASILLQAILDRGDYIVIDRDTTLAREVTIPGDLLIVDARVALEGSVEGTVAVLRGDFFARPRSRVGGRILVFEGGAYPSALAETGEVIYLDPQVSSDVQVQATGYGLFLQRNLPGIVRLPGALGFRIPAYDRVNGASIRWGWGLGFGGDTASVALLGSATYRTAREQLHGGVEFRVRASPRGRLSFSASRSTRTNEGWIRGELPNSLSSLFGRSDVRNYYESDEIRAGLLGLPAPPLVVGEGYVSPTLIFRLSEDRSVPASDPWSLLDRDQPWRPNPPIDEGVLGSVIGGAIFGWRGPTSRASGWGAIEWAPDGIGDFPFGQLRAAGDWWMLGLYQHRVEVSGNLLWPIGTGNVPRQRWSMLGGAGTLPTFPTGAFLGDRLLFIRSSYLADVRHVKLPVVGYPTLRLEYAAGTAWTTGSPRPPLEQNVGAGIQLLFVHGMVHVDPARSPLSPIWSFGAALPLGNGGLPF